MFIILLFFIFARPLIASLAFPYLNSIYSICFIGILTAIFFIKKISFERFKGLKYPLILFCFALAISVIFSSNRLNSVKELYKYLNGLLLFTIASSLNYKDANRIIKTIILSGCIVCLLAAYQYFAGFHFMLDYLAKLKNPHYIIKCYIFSKRVFFPFITPNALAGYLIMLIALVLPFKNSAVFIFLFFITLISTKSLGAFISISIVLGLYFYLCDKANKRKTILLLGAYIILIFISLLRVKTQEYGQPIFSVANRLLYWQDSLAIIKSSPLFGVGIGNFRIPLSRYAHNIYLQIWAEMGIIGIISWLWLIISTIKAGINLNRKYMAAVITYQTQNIHTEAQQNGNFSGITANQYPDYMFPGLISACLVFLLHNSIDFNFFLPEVALIWWTILGLILSKKNPTAQENIL